MAYEVLDAEPAGRYEMLPEEPKAPTSVADTAYNAFKASHEGARNLGFGAIRGAGSIGATLLAPLDVAKDALAGKGLSLESNRQRRADMDSALTSLGADTDSLGFQAGKIGGEVAGTAGTGSLLANGMRAVPWLARSAGPLIDAVGSSGFTAGGVNGLPGLALRTAGGAIAGGASAGLIDPKDAGAGAAIGAATPAVVMGAGKLGGYVGDAMKASQAAKAAEFSRNKPFNDTLQAGIDAGYVVPPSSVNPSFANSTKESISGKIATAQVASAKNQAVTDSLVRKSLGLADDAPLSVEALSKYRKDMFASGYEPLRQLGPVQPGPQFDGALNNVLQQYTGKGTIPAIQKTEINDLVNAHRSTGFDSGDAVDAIRVLREDSKDAFRKGDTALGKAQKAIADAYEKALEGAIPQGSPLLQNYQMARQNIAKSATVEDALKEGAGTVDARKLAAALQKGVPLSGDLLTAARFASAFPKATQPPSLVAGPGVHNLKAAFATGAGTVGGALGAAVGGPIGAAIGSGLGAGTTFVVPAAMRAQMFSKGAQQALVPQLAGPGAFQQLGGLLADPALQQSVLRVAPVVRPGLLSAD